MRKLKAVMLGLAITLTVCSAGSSPNAQAAELVIGETAVPVVALKAEQASEKGLQEFKTTSGNVECSEIHWEAASFSNTEITAEAIGYTNKGSAKCRGPFGTEPVVETNGCHYKFSIGETAEAENPDRTKGSVAITACNATGHITVNASGCTITVPEQAVGPVYFQNDTAASPKDLVIEPKVEGISYHHEGFLCGTGEAKTGSYTGNATVKTSVVGWKVDVSVK